MGMVDPLEGYSPEQRRAALRGRKNAEEAAAAGDYWHGSATGELEGLRKKIAALEERNRWLEIRNGELELKLRGVPAPEK